jgi:hypothetical protein
LVLAVEWLSRCEKRCSVLVVFVQKYRDDPLTLGWPRGVAQAGLAGSPWRIWRQRLALRQDTLVGIGLSITAFVVYVLTLLPGIGSRDTAEFQWVVPTLGLPHPTGYPLYSILGWLWSQLPLGGTPAWRMNLFSAAAAALAIGVVYHLARAIGQRPLIAAGASLALAASQTFWSQATIAEVYGLALLLQALLLLALVRWGAGRWSFWPVGLLLGFGLAHHRSSVLMLPALLLFVALCRSGFAGKDQRATPQAPSLSAKDLLAALAALLGCCLLYLYVPWRAPAWMQTWGQVWEHISGAALTATWLDPARLRVEGAARWLDLARRFVWPQFLPAGALLAGLGVARLLARDRALAALVIGGYLTVFVFCAAYYVADVEVFLLPAHLLAALLLGEGAMLIARALAAGDRGRVVSDAGQATEIARRRPFFVARSSLAGLALLAVPALLCGRNLAVVRALNTQDAELSARAIMAQPLPQGALVIGDWLSTEGPHYLQAVEGLRPDIQFGIGVGSAAIQAAVDDGRAVYLVEPDLHLGLAQSPEGNLWRVSREPIAAATTADIRWDEGIALAGYTLAPRTYQPGDKVSLLLQWQALGVPRHGYTLFVHLVGADGTIWGQCDMEPAQAPTDQWQLGSHYADLVSSVLKPTAPAGRYHINVGWYDSASLRRLDLAGQAGLSAGADYVTLGEIEVVPAR